MSHSVRQSAKSVAARTSDSAMPRQRQMILSSSDECMSQSRGLVLRLNLIMIGECVESVNGKRSDFDSFPGSGRPDSRGRSEFGGMERHSAETLSLIAVWGDDWGIDARMKRTNAERPAGYSRSGDGKCMPGGNVSSQSSAAPSGSCNHAPLNAKQTRRDSGTFLRQESRNRVSAVDNFHWSAEGAKVLMVGIDVQ